MSGKIIDLTEIKALTEIEAPDCSECKEKSKRVKSKIFINGKDFRGISVIYDCDNNYCKRQKEAIELIQINKECDVLD